MTFNRLFKLGMVLLIIYFTGSVAFSALLSPRQEDWLQDGRYVRLTASRYPPGSVTHFDLKALEPPRNTGFFLLAGADRYVAVYDRPGCLLEYRPASGELYDPCRQRAYSIDDLIAGASPPELRLLPVEHRGDELHIDIRPILPGAR
ncbi:MAG TPA: hypothetical protein VIL95_07165 [Bacillota bacterium]